LPPSEPAPLLPLRLAACPPDSPEFPRTRGRVRPRAIAWFGFSSFWGHLRNLLATAIATDSVDARQWMVPESPDELLGRIAAVLGPRGATSALTLAATMGGEIWIDFIADTGDDATVSEAVARLLAADYAVGDEMLPRGDVLIHGGDLAYPVATVREVTRRLIAPFNRVFEPLCDWRRPRVLLAIPGNHDWYDGLDGFARLCQAQQTFEEPREMDDALHPKPNQNPVLAWARAFARGRQVQKPGAMAIAGYVPVQQASYWRLPLARGLDLFGVDRQLRHIDARQRAFFAAETGAPRIVLLPDPARSWGDTRPTGKAALEALDVDPARDPTIVLSGDTHHYERSREGASLHVVAGGGGAFLHGARVTERGAHYPRDAEFPGPKASWAMCKRLPWHLAIGSAGWVITSLFFLADTLALRAYFRQSLQAGVSIAMVTSVAVAIGTALLIGNGRRRLKVAAFSIAFGLAAGALPVALGVGARAAGFVEMGGTILGRISSVWIAILASTLASGAAFGAMLATIARLSLNLSQPFSALGEPGFKHFVRFRIREPADGPPTVEAFVIGVVDPLGGTPPVLVDRFTWSPPVVAGERERDRETGRREDGKG
jgi:Calcineurin-like phosphoesterase